MFYTVIFVLPYMKLIIKQNFDELIITVPHRHSITLPVRERMRPTFCVGTSTQQSFDDVQKFDISSFAKPIDRPRISAVPILFPLKGNVLRLQLPNKD